MSRRLDDEAHGCSEREQAILELTDRGVNDGVVARELGIGLSYVRQVRRMYSGSWRASDRAEAAIRAGSIRYAAALAATGKVYA